MTSLKELFLNKGTEEADVVSAPAFSLTKVMAVVAPLLTGVVTYVTAALEGIEFTSGQLTTIIVALIAFLALTGAADVLARGVATSADKRAAGRLRMVRFETPLAATLELPGRDEAVSVLAASDSVPPEFLCVRTDQKLSWEPAAKVKIE